MFWKRDFSDIQSTGVDWLNKPWDSKDLKEDNYKDVIKKLAKQDRLSKANLTTENGIEKSEIKKKLNNATSNLILEIPNNEKVRILIKEQVGATTLVAFTLQYAADFKSSLDRSEGMSNVLVYDVSHGVSIDSEQFFLPLTPTPRFRTSILVPYQASSNQIQLTKKNIENLIDYIKKFSESTDYFEFENMYGLPRPILLQTLIHPGAIEEGRMLCKKRKAIELLENYTESRKFTHNYNHFFIHTNHSLTQNTIGKINNFFANNKLTNTANTIKELEHVVRAYSNWIYSRLCADSNFFLKDGFIEHIIESYHDPYCVWNEVEHDSEIHRIIFMTKALRLYSNAMHTFIPSKTEMISRASYEVILINFSGGICQSSCKSGKDREGLLNLLIDSILIFERNKGQFPDFFKNAEDRNLFSSIFEDLFFSEHAQKIAALNAPGAYGLKNVDNILPDFIIKSLKSCANSREYEAFKAVSKFNKIPAKKTGCKIIKNDQKIKDVSETEYNTKEKSYDNTNLCILGGKNKHHYEFGSNTMPIFRNMNITPPNLTSKTPIIEHSRVFFKIIKYIMKNHKQLKSEIQKNSGKNQNTKLKKIKELFS